jgi:lipase
MSTEPSGVAHRGHAASIGDEHANDAPSSQVRFGTVGSVAWIAAGGAHADATPLLLLHGLSDSAECWMPIVSHFAGDRMVVAVDARGHGRTPLGDEAFSIAALARDAVAVVREVVRRPAFVVGHSMGGLVAEEIALTEPDLVAALLLEEPAWSAASETSDDGVPAFIATFFATFAGVPEDKLVRWSQAQCPTWAEDEHGPWARAKVQVDQRLAQAPQDWGGRDWLEELAKLTCPVTLVTGVPERGSVLNSAERARAAELLGDNLVDVQLPGAGHSARRDDRAGFIAALDHALETVVET